MAWTPKFTGLPTQTDIIVLGDSYTAGSFTIAGDGSDRTLRFGSSPIAYESLASIGASISNVLRVTSYVSAIGPFGVGLGGGPILYGPDRTDQFFAWGNSDGDWQSYATENGANATIGTTFDAGAAVWVVRLYWNGTGSAFVIPDAGFGSHNIPATSQSSWYSKDNGTTWNHLGDRAIAVGVAPTRFGFGAVKTILGDKSVGSVLVSTMEVMEEGAAPNPYLENQSPGDGTVSTDADVLISVDIKDPEGDIDLATLNVTVDSGGGPVAAYTAGVGFVAPYDGAFSSLTPIVNGYTLVLDNTASFTNGSVTTRVVVQDILANPLDSSWTFDITLLVDNTLWAMGANGLLYFSFDQGTTWVAVDTSSLTGWLNGLWGPINSWKVYVGVGDDGTYYYDGSWHLEDANGPWWNAVASRPETQTLWCADDDSIVCAAGWSSAYDNVIRTRPGAPGTPWVTEFNGGSSGYFTDIHGAPDGSAIFAIRSFLGGGGDVSLLKRGSGGVWTEVASITDGNSHFWTQVRVISDTEVWITGGYYIGGVTLAARIWKWNGSVLSVEYEDTDWRADGIIGLWMAKDGSEGLALYQVNGPSSESDYFLYYNGSTWSVAQGEQYGKLSADITQRDGIPASGVAFLTDSSLRKYSGVSWDNTYSYSYPDPGNIIWNQPLEGTGFLLRYLEYVAGPIFTSHDKTLLSQGAIWTDQNPTPPSSSFAFGPTDSPPRVAYDPFRNKFLLVGYDTADQFAEYDPDTNLWSAISLVGTPGVNFPAMNGDALKADYDATNRQLLVFVSSPAALWSWDPTSGWNKLTLLGDSIESMRSYESQIVYDPFRLALWIIGRPLAGGSDPVLYLIDLTSLTVVDQSPSGGVAGTDYPDFTDRLGFAAAYDPALHSLLVSHGGDATIPTLYSDTWAFNGAWTDVTPASTPEPRSLCMMAVGIDDQLVHLLGGIDDSGSFQDEWVWNGTIWTKRAVSGTGATYLGFNMGVAGRAL